MDNMFKNSETLVNYMSTSTSAVNQDYSEPTVNTESLSFKIKNNFVIAFTMTDNEPIQESPIKDKDEIQIK